MTDDTPQRPAGRKVDVVVPREIDSLSDIATSNAFLYRGGLVDAWFEAQTGSDVLAVTFDNLSSIGEYDPPQPWLRWRVQKAGVALLGIMATRKDWYRNPDTAALIVSLRDAGLFARFRRVVFVGASMGGFAALAYLPLVPGAAALAFSPQSTLARSLARFDKRYPYATRKWDWSSPDHLDAAEAGLCGAEVTLVYDPFVKEDHAHARRILGPGVRHVPVRLTGHRAIRQIKEIGGLQELIEGVLSGTPDLAGFYRTFRARRSKLAWQRALIAELRARGHHTLMARALSALQRDYPESGFAQREARRMAKEARQARRSAQTFAADGAEKRIVVPDGTPAPPFSGLILDLQQAIVVPERETDTKLASGVLRADGSYCDLSQGWIRARRPIPAPTLHPSDRVDDLPGTHLFGGHFRGHFGHFLVESTARLWALDHLPVQPDSILYLPYRGEVGAIEKAMEGHDRFYRLLGIDLPIRTYGTPKRVERLFVPELGFGWSERYAGSPAYRAFMQQRLRAAVAPDGAKKLYISRNLLGPQRGGVLGEGVLEQNLARAGYEIFHPEKHPLDVQIARYRAAERIVALDGSALHLAAYVVDPGTRVAMILRRSKTNIADYLLQFRSFGGIDPDVIDVIRTDWVSGDISRVDFRSVGELDFASLFKALAEKGYLSKTFRPTNPNPDEIASMLSDFAGRRGAEMRPLRQGEQHADDEAAA
jgi:hypothetical protein